MSGDAFTLDTVGISFPVSDYDPTGGTVRIVNYGKNDQGDHREVSHKLPSGGFVSFGKGANAWLEASLPKAMNGENVHGVTVAQAFDVLEQLHREAGAFCTPCVAPHADGGDVDGRDVRQAYVKRLDVVRDFAGVPVRPVLDSLERAPRYGRKVLIKRFADPEAGGAETLRVGVRSSWSSVLYDKHAETGGVAPVGHLRYETRVRTKFLTGAHLSGLAKPIAALEDLNAGTVAVIGVDRFHAAGFGARVNGDAHMRRLLEDLQLSDSDYMTFLGYMSAVANGYPVRMSRNTVAKYRRLAKKLGVVPGEVLELEHLSWLDLATGQLMTSVSDPRIEDRDD